MKLRTLVPVLLWVSLCQAAIASPYSFLVKIVGHGKPMILIPGLSCGPDEWKSTIERYQDRYECHVFTLPGFAGQPPIKAPILSRVRDEVIDYIAENHLDHPVIVGHSLGGMLAFWIASKSPASVGKVVSVDGLPWLPAALNPSTDMTSVTQQSEMLRSLVSAMDATTFAAAEKQSLSTLITNQKDIDFILKTSILSDPASVGEAMYEMYTTDLRPLVSKITTPVLLLASGSYSSPELKTSMLDRYEAQIHTIPRHTLRMSDKAKHFIMLDDPVFFFRELDTFLGS